SERRASAGRRDDERAPELKAPAEARAPASVAPGGQQLERGALFFTTAAQEQNRRRHNRGSADAERDQTDQLLLLRVLHELLVLFVFGRVRAAVAVGAC